jgi:CHRD domain-containing protein
MNRVSRRRQITDNQRKERTMRTCRRLAGLFVATIAALSAAPLFAHDKEDHSNFATSLTGYEETPSTINSAASGDFKLRISNDGASIQYALSYRDLPSPITQSHIHFGRPGLNGGVVLFLCTNLAPPAGVPVPPLCPLTSATITGTLSATDVVPIAGQSIDAGAAGFADVIKAIRAGAAYANVHTTGHPGGEIRGALRRDDDDEDD